MRAVRALANNSDVATLYDTPVGLKIQNQLVNSEQLSYPFLSDRQLDDVDPADLSLGIDGLRDRHTLIDVPLAESPHASLMGALSGGRTLDESDYVVRVRDGRLDMRPPREITNAVLEELHDRFAECMTALEGGATLDVKVVRFEGRLYIADGKHRAACALLRGRPVRCEDVTPIYYDSFFFWVRRRMTENAHVYTKHLRLLDAIAGTVGMPQ